MRRLQLTSGMLTFLLLANPAYGQSVLDRVDPGRAEERAREKATERRDDQLSNVEPTSTQEPDQIEIAVGAIDLTGLEALPRADFTGILEDYIGRTLTGSDLAQLVERLATRARATYPLASAHIEPQALRAGVLRVEIDEGRIDRIRLDGSRNSSILQALSPLISDRPVTRAELERRLLVAGDIDGATLGEARIMREDGMNILVVETQYQAVQGQITLDNDSSDPLGPVELFGNVRINGILSDDDTLQLFALDTVPQVGELAFGRLRYGKRVSASGTELSVSGSYSRSAPGAYLESLAIEGASWGASLGLLHPLSRSRRASLWLDAAIAYRELRQDREDILVRKDRLRTVSAGLYGYADAAGGRLRANATLTQGLDVFGATREGDPLASREDADGSYTSLAFFADWSKAIVGDFGMKLAVRTQVSTQPLLISEEMGLGGETFVRGYDYSERSGDQAVAAYGELNHIWRNGPKPLNGLEVYGFVDGGKTTNFDHGYGSGKLFSSGGGFRADVDRNTDASIEVAVPLSGERYDTDDTSPKVRFSVSRHF